MEDTLALIMSALIIIYALMARPAQKANLTAPMLSLIAGAIIYLTGHGPDVKTSQVHLVAEIALVLVLFHDASTVKLTQLRKDAGVCVRLLAIGFPMAVIITAGVVALLLPGLPGAAVLLIAAAITPTDAGLGAPTVLNPVVPLRTRRALNVESGLNDGLATPLVLVALSMLAADEQAAEPTVLQMGLVPVLLALAVSIPVALAVAWVLDRSREHHLSSRAGRMLVIVFTPLFLFALADAVGANIFIAAFVAGLTFGAASTTINEEEHSTELLETASDLLGFVVWFLSGALLVIVFQDGIKWQWFLIALLSLTVLRMVPVAISLMGTGFGTPTVLFIGWFGPRGLATIVFGLLTVDELGGDSPYIRDITGVLGLIVLFSVFAHGLSASPLSERYGQWARREATPTEDQESVQPLSARGRTGAMHDAANTEAPGG